MGKARIVGNNAIISIHSQALLTPIPLGEIDSFKAKSLTTVNKSRPIGFQNTRATLQYGGYDLSFEIGKVDWALGHYYWLQDRTLRGGELPPELFINETIYHYDGTIENYVYNGVTLFDFDISRAIDDCNERIQGFAASRDSGIFDTTLVNALNPIDLIHEVIFKRSREVKEIASDVAKGVIKGIESIL